MNRILIIGGGILGIYSALMVRNFNKNSEVHLIESSNDLGGLLGYADCQGLKADLGVHTFYETGVSEIDEILFSVIPEGGWKVLTGVARDLGGSIDSLGINVGNPYLLTAHNPITRNYPLAKLVSGLSYNLEATHSNAYEMIEKKFGNFLAANLIAPYIEKFSGRSARETSTSVANLLPIQRVNLGSAQEYDKLIKPNKELRNLVAIPDQRLLDESLIPHRKAYYPAKYGTFRYVDALKERLNRAGVHVHTKTRCELLSEGYVRVAPFSNRLEYSHIISTLPLLNNYRFVGLSPDFDIKSKRTLVCTLIVDNSLAKVQDLYYLYDHRLNTKLHRVGFPHNYCETLPTKKARIITCEYLINNMESLDLDEVIQDLEDACILKRANILNIFSHEIAGGYPTPSLKSELSLQNLRNQYIDLSDKHKILHVGLGSNTGKFLQYELIKFAHEKIMNTFLA